MAELQEYIDQNRQSHYLEGDYCEYIVPNSTAFSREGELYADIAVYQDGEPEWHDPVLYQENCALNLDTPPSWDVCRSLSSVGAFSRKGLDIMSSVWGKVEFKKTESWEDTEKLTCDMPVSFEKAELIPDHAKEEQVFRHLYEYWQLPMYNIDFGKIPVSLEDLTNEQEGILAREMRF